MPLRIAIADDIPAIVAIERNPVARQFVANGLKSAIAPP